MWRKQTGTTLDFILLWDFLLSLISAKKYFAGNGKTYALGKELNKVPFFKKKISIIENEALHKIYPRESVIEFY